MSSRFEAGVADIPTGIPTLAGRLRGQLLPAALTPMHADGSIAVGDLERYAAALAGYGGVAVWAHTGRGPYLNAEQQTAVLRTFRAATDAPIVAGIAPAAAEATADPAPHMLRMADRAAQLGADALMVFPPPRYADAPDREIRLRALHEQIAEQAGLPLVLFLLHAEAGGYPYSLSLLRDLFSIPQVIGIKLATLDSAMSCQDVIRLIRAEFPGKLAITGEDRMFGPSLMWGADAALVGIAAAAGGLSARLLSSWYGDRREFVSISAAMDDFAYATFTAPMEGYVQRMMWAAEYEGLISSDAAHDPYGPKLPATERDQVRAALERATAFLAGTR